MSARTLQKINEWEKKKKSLECLQIKETKDILQIVKQ